MITIVIACIIAFVILVAQTLIRKDENLSNNLEMPTGVESNICRAENSNIDRGKIKNPTSNVSMLDMNSLLYPSELPTFEELEKSGHKDLRGVVYTFLGFDVNRKKPFTDEDLIYDDFGKKKEAYAVLQKCGLICQLELSEEIENIFTRKELVRLAKERDIQISGTKRTLVKRLMENGFKLDRRRYRNRLFRVTEKGKSEIAKYQGDYKKAICEAVNAWKIGDYQKAVDAYRVFDSRWGFVHTSGKKHTIFAHRDISYIQFDFIGNYPMNELNNTDNFKNTLRACLLAGLMRGCQEEWELKFNFEENCNEKIDCPVLLSLFDYEEDVIEEMQRQVEYDSGNALRYYISHVLYMSRIENREWRD